MNINRRQPMTAMKISLLTHHFPPSFTAGAEQYAYRMALELQRQGHKVEVVCVESVLVGSLEPIAQTETYHGLKVHRLYFNVKRAPSALEWSFRNPQLGAWMKRYLEYARPDIVHVNSGYLLGGTTLEAAFELGIPVALTLHDYWFLCPMVTLLRTEGDLCDGNVPAAQCVWCFKAMKRRFRYLGPQVTTLLGDIFVAAHKGDAFSSLSPDSPEIGLINERRAYLKAVFEKVDLAIAPSRFILEKHQDYGLQARRMVYLPFGLEQSAVKFEAQPSSASEVRFGFLGQLAPHKGPDLLIEAVQHIEKSSRPWQLSLYGGASSPAFRNHLWRLAQGMAQVAFRGPYPNARVSEILFEIDVLVVPSIWLENRPTVIVEAQAAGVPVVAARIGGIEELVEDGKNGLLFEPGNALDLADKLQRILADTELLRTLKTNKIDVPDVRDEMTTLLSLFERLLHERVGYR